MTETTFDPLPEKAAEILAKGEDVYLYAITNVAYPSPGYFVYCLVRRGLFVEKRHHIADDPMMSYTVYGPSDQPRLAPGPSPAKPATSGLVH